MDGMGGIGGEGDMADVNVDAAFKVVGAFEMPAQRFDPVRGLFSV